MLPSPGYRVSEVGLARPGGSEPRRSRASLPEAAVRHRGVIVEVQVLYVQ